MKKLKIFLPSIALIVVLAFSITIGVYAATSTTFSISSTVSFSSPDLDSIIIKAYIGQTISEETLAFTYDSSTSLNQEVVWKFEDDQKLEFTREKVGDDYNSAYLTFVITSGVPMPTYAYFVDNTTNNNHLKTDVLKSSNQKTTDENGEEVPLPLVNVSFVDDSVADDEGVIDNDSISV
ncbi:MAG: hypothetical protein IJW25_03140, partial [Clostridia bacterium]|nr:hypothetical protein [Clostridia bacterium]